MRKIFLVALILMLAPVLSACGALVVGGAATGGYYVGKDERTLEEISSDTMITSTINTRYVRDSNISALDINVDTSKGIVTLHGSVSNQQALSKAVSIARSVKDVKQVISKLTVIPK